MSWRARIVESFTPEQGHQKNSPAAAKIGVAESWDEASRSALTVRLSAHAEALALSPKEKEQEYYLQEIHPSDRRVYLHKAAIATLQNRKALPDALQQYQYPDYTSRNCDL